MHQKTPGPEETDPILRRGAGNRNRTYDLRITNAPLYQLSYSGKPLIVGVQPSFGQSLQARHGARGRRLS